MRRRERKRNKRGQIHDNVVLAMYDVMFVRLSQREREGTHQKEIESNKRNEN